MLRLMFERKKNKLTQEQLAEKIGVTRQTINNWETGKVFPSVAMLLKLSETLKVSVDYLLERED